MASYHLSAKTIGITNIPQIGAEFHVYLNKYGKMANYTDSTRKKRILIVDKIVYDPFIRDEGEHDHIPYDMCDVKVYLIDKPKPIEIK
jgi:hypothetical protein